MGRGWLRWAALGVAVSALLGLAADLARPAVQGVALQGNPSPLAQKARTAVLGLLAVGAVAYGASDGTLDASPASASLAALLGSLLNPSGASGAAAAPPPSWAVLASVAALLAAIASPALHRRPVPSPQPVAAGSGPAPFLFMTTSRGPLFRQTAILMALGPRGWAGDSGPQAGEASRGFIPPRGIQGLLDMSRSARRGDGAYVLPFGEADA